MEHTLDDEIVYNLIQLLKLNLTIIDRKLSKSQRLYLKESTIKCSLELLQTTKYDISVESLIAISNLAYKNIITADWGNDNVNIKELLYYINDNLKLFTPNFKADFLYYVNDINRMIKKIKSFEENLYNESKGQICKQTFDDIYGTFESHGKFDDPGPRVFRNYGYRIKRRRSR